MSTNHLKQQSNAEQPALIGASKWRCRLDRPAWYTTQDGGRLSVRVNARYGASAIAVAGRASRGIARRLKPQAHATKPAAAGWCGAPPVCSPRRRALLIKPATLVAGRSPSWQEWCGAAFRVPQRREADTRRRNDRLVRRSDLLNWAMP